MIDSLLKVEAKILENGEVSYEDFQMLRAFREYINDLEEQFESNSSGLAAPQIKNRSSGSGLAIVVGHTRRRPGASATNPINQSEYPWNRDLASKIKSECQILGVESRIFFRDNIGISGAYRQVAEWGAACVMELHFNAFNGSAHGTETLYDAETNSGSKAWAERLQKAMHSSLGLRNRKIKDRDPGERGYRSVSAINIPSALIEPFFGDNRRDAQIGHANKDDLAEALAQAAASQLAVS